MSAEEFSEQLQDLLESIQLSIEKELTSLKGFQRLEKCSYLRNRLNRAKQLHRSIVVETREFDADLKEAWQVRIKTFDTEIQKYLSDVTWAETSSDKDPSKPVNFDDMGTREIQAQAMAIQDKSMDAAGRARRMIDETIEIGTGVNAELHKQGEQIGNIQENVDKIQSDMKKANGQIKIFMRRMQTDKVILLLTFIVAIGVVLAVILTILVKAKVVKLS